MSATPPIRNAKALFRKEPLDDVQLACKVHGLRLWHEGGVGLSQVRMLVPGRRASTKGVELGPRPDKTSLASLPASSSGAVPHVHTSDGGRRPLASAAAIVIASAIAGAPIRTASQDQPRPMFRTEANYVRVDAYTTTKDGVPIDDLRRDEFELLEDRVPQTIDQFATVRIQEAGRRRPGPIRALRKKAVRPRPMPVPVSSSSSSMLCTSIARRRSGSRSR